MLLFETAQKLSTKQKRVHSDLHIDMQLLSEKVFLQLIEDLDHHVSPDDLLEILQFVSRNP